MYISRKLLTFGLLALMGLVLSGVLFADDPSLAQKSTLEAILASGKITVCSDPPYEPFEFQDDKGNLVGFDVDLIKMLAKQAGVSFEFLATPFDTIIPALNARNCDLIASDITATLKRALSANFTDPYLQTGQIAMVSTGKSPGKNVTDYSRLNSSDVIITVQLGTTGEEAARSFFPKADIRTFDNAQLTLQEVVDGRADAIVYDEVFLRPQVANVGSKAELCCPRGNPDLLTQEFISLAIRKGDPDFLSYLNLFMRQAKETIKVTADLAAEFGLPAETIGQSFLQALRTKWGV
ncbi:MAG: hypothetical protein A2Z21_00870 [Candidatus Fraserbacteria bacterium RBG_16_55_9]|uniref:Solute-binding protein family 3/N-terminal domain-containing protein n=1 Tax=Fraserbacteria sp. (strain RBG_16_55_9) TaxID=1817864 RepID=A0A1F5V2S8_FRAXR|nr:MAG: hypothetical protein A2Z21_00870 [Candidatus Fraserbacteria bacterium RBG_16_55_9]